MLVTSQHRASLPPELDRSVLNNLGARIQRNGAVLIYSAQLPIARGEWIAIEQAAKSFIYEPHEGCEHCRVAELLSPNYGFQQSCRPIVELMLKPEVRELITAAVGQDVDPCAMRVLELRMGGRLGPYNPGFRAPFAIMRLEGAYEGGAHFQVPPSGIAKDYPTPPHSLLWCRGDTTSGLRIVTNGVRRVLVLEFNP